MRLCTSDPPPGGPPLLSVLCSSRKHPFNCHRELHWSLSTHGTQWGETEWRVSSGPTPPDELTPARLGESAALFRARCSHVSAYQEAFLIHLLRSLVLPREGK